MTKDIKHLIEDECLRSIAGCEGVLRARSLLKLKRYKEAVLAYEEDLDNVNGFEYESGYASALVENRELDKALMFLLSRISSKREVKDEYPYDLISVYFLYVMKFDRRLEFSDYFNNKIDGNFFKIKTSLLFSIFEYACETHDPIAVSCFESYLESAGDVDKRFYRLHISYLIDQDKDRSLYDLIYRKGVLYLDKSKDIALFSIVFKYISCVSYSRTQSLIQLSIDLFGLDRIKALKLNKSLITNDAVSANSERQSDLRFKRLLSYEYRNGEIGGFKLPYLISSKVNAYSIGGMLGVKSPLLYSNLKLQEIELSDNIVIKPADGNQSKGVFLVYSEDKIFDVSEGEFLKGYDVLLDRASAYRRENKYRDLWIVEKLLTHNKKMARDVKFYCFYGKVLLALESVREPGQVLRNWHDRSGEIVETGRYDNLGFASLGLSNDLFTQAENLSLNLPVPFMRIDFLVSDEAVYMGEFTPVPYGYWEFNAYHDRLLGYELYAARNRLLNDMISGKEFYYVKSLLKGIK
ncbi:ATP-grasp fold amidoligase family protein [Halomonas sp. H2]|uniref:ATP-grasp fold amidoligase family protein n=1 Tax=Halomonas sp. H2 TaxID=261936 RepID=UPI003CEAA145